MICISPLTQSPALFFLCSFLCAVEFSISFKTMWKRVKIYYSLIILFESLTITLPHISFVFLIISICMLISWWLLVRCQRCTDPAIFGVLPKKQVTTFAIDFVVGSAPMIVIPISLICTVGFWFFPVNGLLMAVLTGSYFPSLYHVKQFYHGQNFLKRLYLSAINWTPKIASLRKEKWNTKLTTGKPACWATHPLLYTPSPWHTNAKKSFTFAFQLWIWTGKK